MSCFFPKLAFQNLSVKQRLRWTGLDFYSDTFKRVPRYSPGTFLEYHPSVWKPLKVRCGGCIDCRLSRSREMAIRCVHEAQMHRDVGSCFITLTYSPEHLPPDGNFDFRHPVLFMKRLRRLFGSGLKSYGCAEYGEKGGRAHYHILVFGLWPKDLLFWRNSKNPRVKCKLFRSRSVERCWGKGRGKNFSQFGNVEIGDVTFNSAAYVARYVMKKDRKSLDLHRELGRFSEKAICVSRRPGIGFSWLEKFVDDVYPADEVLYKSSKGSLCAMKPPKFYDRKVEELGLVDFSKIRVARELSACENSFESSKSRVAVKRKLKEDQLSRLKRSYEDA